MKSHQDDARGVLSAAINAACAAGYSVQRVAICTQTDKSWLSLARRGIKRQYTRSPPNHARPRLTYNATLRFLDRLESCGDSTLMGIAAEYRLLLYNNTNVI